MAAECLNKNQCRCCHQAGHLAKNCTNAYGTAPPAASHDLSPRGAGNAPPAAAHVVAKDPLLLLVVQSAFLPPLPLLIPSPPSSLLGVRARVFCKVLSRTPEMSCLDLLDLNPNR